jgi:hypothetical protein
MKYLIAICYVSLVFICNANAQDSNKELNKYEIKYGHFEDLTDINPTLVQRNMFYYSHYKSSATAIALGAIMMAGGSTLMVISEGPGGEMSQFIPGLILTLSGTVVLDIGAIRTIRRNQARRVLIYTGNADYLD